MKDRSETPWETMPIVYEIDLFSRIPLEKNLY